MSKPALATLLISFAIGSLPAQKFEYTKQAEIDAQGGIYVSSANGKLIKMADKGHCGEAVVAPRFSEALPLVGDGVGRAMTFPRFY